MLPSELVATDLPSSQDAPQFSFGIGHIVSKRSL
jgi:hypothetical protein